MNDKERYTMQAQQQHHHPETRNTAVAERTWRRPVTSPATDIYETDESIVVFTDMPGVSEKNVNITLEKDVLTIDGHPEPVGRSGYTLAYSEYEASDYRRIFTLSADVQREGIEASVRDGVLKLIIPKAEPARVRKIEVRGS
jgi:HSP20 family protein